ncbi:hypothetical protein [Aequorivita viscosa]|uniref:Uncharacterized protein n=1 Tax=Aequorivita viscosa TaxID=797419 RepID=A0A1M6C7W9_9FLAO|nr:hypothetical protein [Aequorivita viscosa]SDW24880.1 hypothetical protein SAMN05216556_103161 [Aequorivita viscosa]SHI57125.1 hypothetical protein SAMN04487908_103160 [Aequorivita viscosa]
MKKFRLPRKTKKRLRKGLWFYPPDEKGGSLMASPYRSQEDYDAYKKGELRNLGVQHNSRKHQNEFRNKIDKEIKVTDDVLKNYLDDLMAKEFRDWAFNILVKAKNHPKAKSSYYNFVNAYLLHKNDGSFGNVACLAVDRAEELLKKRYDPSKKKQITLK